MNKAAVDRRYVPERSDAPALRVRSKRTISHAPQAPQNSKSSTAQVCEGSKTAGARVGEGILKRSERAVVPVAPAIKAPNVTSIAASPSPRRLSVAKAQLPLIVMPSPHAKPPSNETVERLQPVCVCTAGVRSNSAKVTNRLHRTVFPKLANR